MLHHRLKTVFCWVGYLCLFLTTLVLLHVGYLKLNEYHTNQLIQPVPFSDASYLHLGDHKPIIRLKAGQFFFLHFESERTVSCSVDVSYRLITESVANDQAIDRTVYSSFGDTHAVINKGHYRMDIRLQVPRDMAPGNYLLDRAASYSCDGTNIDKAPRIPLTIVR